MALNLEGQSERFKRILNRFMKGVFNAKPALPRYHTTWDPERVLRLFQKWEDNPNLNFRELTIKTACLLTLLSGRRGQTIVSIKVENIVVLGSEMRISLD